MSYLCILELTTNISKTVIYFKQRTVTFLHSNMPVYTSMETVSTQQHFSILFMYRIVMAIYKRYM